MTRYTATITTKQATETGALDGHAITCTCGLRWSTSLSAQHAEGEAREHLAWHARVGK